jgi:3-hydroxyisobutyrate dehydrogenase-like beta-hydroxyacid dehydrogenase
MQKSVGVAGLGRMGMPVAKVLIGAGYHVVGYDISPEAVNRLVDAGGESAPDCQTMAAKTNTIIVFVLNGTQVVDVVAGEKGLLKNAAKGHTIVCMSTIDIPSLEHVAAQCAAKGVAFVDSPCTGGPARAENGTLALMTATPEDVLDVCRTVLERIGEINHVGKAPGMGQAAKCCNQLMITVVHAALMEMVLMARKSGLDAKQTCDVIAAGAAGCDHFRVVAESLLAGTPAPCTLGVLIKDSNIVMNFARSLKLPLLTANAANQYFQASDAQGLREAEATEMIRILEQLVEGG